MLRNENAKKIIDSKGWSRNKFKLLGAGVNGRVYNLGPYAMKMSRDRTNIEYKILKELEHTGVVPKVHNTPYIGQTKIAFLMNKFPVGSITLKDYKAKFSPSSRDKKLSEIVRDAIQKIHSAGISHGDLHDGNIMVSYDEVTHKIKKLWLFDFGRSIRIPKGQTEASVYNKLPKVTGYSKIYGSLYGRHNFPSRKNYDLQKLTPVKSLGTNAKGRAILRGPRGGLYVMDGSKKIYKPRKMSAGSQLGVNSKGRQLMRGPRGGVFVIHNGKKLYKSS